MRQKKKPRRRKKRLRFQPKEVFDVEKDDLDFDLEKEVARYRAQQGQAGRRRPHGLQPRSDFKTYFV